MALYLLGGLRRHGLEHAAFDEQIEESGLGLELNVLYLMVTTDTNNDGRLTFADESRPYVYRIGTDRAEPMVTPEIGQAMQAIMR